MDKCMLVSLKSTLYFNVVIDGEDVNIIRGNVHDSENAQNVEKLISASPHSSDLLPTKHCPLSVVCFLLCGADEDTDLQNRNNWAWC